MRAIKVAWRRSKTFTILTLLQYLIAIFFIYAVFILPSVELKIAAGSMAIAISSIASTDLNNVLDKQKIDQILDKLSKMEDLQKEIQKEQSERASSSPSIVASLEAMSQYYMDYINKQKREDKK